VHLLLVSYRLQPVPEGLTNETDVWFAEHFVVSAFEFTSFNVSHGAGSPAHLGVSNVEKRLSRAFE
jgi:hypothetical protein